MSAGGKRRVLSSLRIWAAIVAGTLATWSVVAVGLWALKRATRVDHRDVDSFLFELDHSLPLEESMLFSGAAVGYGGQAPATAPAFLKLLADENGEAKLVELAARGAAGGRLYGLCGLRLLGSKRVGDDPLLVARWDDRRVALAQGCSLTVSTPAEVVRTSRFANMCDGWASLRNPSW